MGTIAEKLNYLNTTKTNIKNAIVAKGVSVSEDDTFRSYASKIADIEPTLGTKTITANGTYTASDDSLQGYSSVTVDIDDTDLYRDTTDSTYESVKTLSNCGAFPMLSLTAEINAVQDLHGYDKPWAGGAGKNKFDKSTVNVDKYIGADGNLAQSQYNQDVTDYIPVVGGQTYMISHARNTNNYSCFYDENKTVIGSVFANNQFPIESPTNAKYMRVTFGKADVDAFQVEIGTTSTSYSPYSNICPISGWDSIDVYRCGKNLLPTGRGYDFPYNADYGTVLDVDTDTPDWIDDENGEYEVTLSDWQRCGLLSNQLPIGETVYVRIKIVSGSPRLSTYTLDADYRVIRKFSNYNPASDGLDYNTQIQLAENEHYVGVAIVGYNNKVIIRNPHIVLNTDEPYEPYNGQTHTTALSTTCYGGSKDIKGNERINRKITIPNGTGTYAEKMSVRKSGSTERNSYYFILDSAVTPNTTEVMCNMFDFIGNISSVSDSNAGECFYTESNQQFRFTLPMDSELQTADQVNAWLAELYNNGTPLQIVEVLATPTTATSDAIDLTLAEGVNNLWANSGDVGDARYFKKVEL